MNQKELAKQYSFLNGKRAKVYIGKTPCKMKHIEKELSVSEKENTYGEYKEIEVVIQKTHFNGKTLSITPEYFECGGVLLPFKINKEHIGKLRLVTPAQEGHYAHT